MIEKIVKLEKKIYCDGACSGNPGPGAWAYVIFENNIEVAFATGCEKNTTNNRMELMAAIMALQSLSENESCSLIVDSQYLRNGITSWIFTWKKNGWKSSSGQVKNRDLWERLDSLTQNVKIEWIWQKGHANSLHDRADELARGAVKNSLDI